MMLQVVRNWTWLQRSQWFDKEQLFALQAKGLNNIVRYAFHRVPFYQKLYSAAGVLPDQRDNYVDRLPIIKREQFKLTPLSERTAIDVDVNSCMPHTTSGSTGIPVTLLEDPSWTAWQEALKLRMMWAWGIRPLDRICRAIHTRTGLSRFSLAEKQGLWSTIRRRRVKQLWLSTDINDHLKFFSIWKPDVLISVPSYLRTLTRLSEETGQNLAFKLVVSSSELLDDSTRRLVEDKLQTQLFDHYGTEETGSLAWECPTHFGYHINADSVIIELLQNERQVSAGEPGKVYATPFRRFATPVIRYFTGDVATRVDDGCSCGRTLFMLKNIQGRIMDYILTTDDRYISPYAVTAVLNKVTDVEQYKVIQRRDFSIEVLVKTDAEQSAQVLQNMRECCRGIFGETPFSVRLVDKIENEGPKFRMVESSLTV